MGKVPIAIGPLVAAIAIGKSIGKSPLCSGSMAISKGQSISMAMVLGVISNCTIAMYHYCWVV